MSTSAAYSTEVVHLDGSSSVDADGQISAFRWMQTTGPTIALSNAGTSMADFTVPRLDRDAEVRIELQVTDNDGATARTEVSILLTPAPIQFVVEIAGDEPFVESTLVSLRVTSATLGGADVVPVALTWGSSLQGELANSVTIDQPVDVALAAGDHVLTLTGDFAAFGVATYSTTVTVMPAPSGNASPTAIATSSTSAAYSSQIVRLNGTASTDTDGQISSYRWSQVAGPTVAIADSGASSTEFAVPPMDGDAVVVLALEVTDDQGAAGRTELSVQLTPAPVLLAVEISGGNPYVETEAVMLLVSSATLDGVAVAPTSLKWESSLQGSVASSVAINQSVVAMLTRGNHELTLTGDFAQLGVVTFSTDLEILPGSIEIPTYLSTPVSGYTQLMPVVLVTHIPTQDGDMLDLGEANYSYRPPEWQTNSVDDLIAYIETINIRQKFMLEEMSRFRGYKRPGNRPYLGYQVVAHYIFYDALPLSSRNNPFDRNQKMVDFAALMNKIDGQDWVDDEAVREFWFNNYFNEKFQFWESNMSSPTTPDISNSDQFSGDLPVYSKSYVIYGTNYHRTQAEAVHNHGHQIERMLDYIDRRASGSSALFWGEFVGVPNFPGPAMIPGRCGWTHQPPNTTIDYGYTDMTVVNVDCENWKPDGTGVKVPVNAAYFDTLSYAWPDGNIDFPQRAETQFYIWWGQNMPGRENQIPFDSTTMENWWRIIGDWDSAIDNGINLYK